jgi:hypothetical protein
MSWATANRALRRQEVVNRPIDCADAFAAVEVWCECPLPLTQLSAGPANEWLIRVDLSGSTVALRTAGIGATPLLPGAPAKVSSPPNLLIPGRLRERPVRGHNPPVPSTSHALVPRPRHPPTVLYQRKAALPGLRNALKSGTSLPSLPEIARGRTRGSSGSWAPISAGLKARIWKLEARNEIERFPSTFVEPMTAISY